MIGVGAGSVLSWEIGVIGTILFVWMVFGNLLGNRYGDREIVLLMALNGGHEQDLDSPWTKAFVSGISVGVGAVYLFWDLKRHPRNKP